MADCCRSYFNKWFFSLDYNFKKAAASEMKTGSVLSLYEKRILIVSRFCRHLSHGDLGKFVRLFPSLNWKLFEA